ncbi:hypothetical protein SAMN04515674_101418 [Pseudarcicella hirudinis]|uniref:Uncharacterized protein n=1 Tax=Pseudarcicella hirudinis TaxID=1079859 RepID=A0A1I5MRQ7_9BACT|nr:hypothetical protein [Pseudarcicella hirudinis]SFP12199.1 hypothetical protein SAMN04515674_101418 [Pseudarcicella hirudinis]
MVEVFKTNVKNKNQAKMLIHLIYETFQGYVVNFDLEDCDRILRVKCESGCIESEDLIHFLQKLGVQAEILPDETPPGQRSFLSSGINFHFGTAIEQAKRYF